VKTSEFILKEFTYQELLGPPHLWAVLQLAAHIPQEVGILEADNPVVGNLAVLQVEHTLDVAGIPHVLEAEDSLALEGPLKHTTITYCQPFAESTLFICGLFNNVVQ
jgi:hypothetical protein